MTLPGPMVLYLQLDPSLAFQAHTANSLLNTASWTLDQHLKINMGQTELLIFPLPPHLLFPISINCTNSYPVAQAHLSQYVFSILSPKDVPNVLCHHHFLPGPSHSHL